LGFGEYLSLAPAPLEARVGGRSVLLIPARAADLGPDAASLPGRKSRDLPAMGISYPIPYLSRLDQRRVFVKIG
jgi:hypothetical protein